MLRGQVLSYLAENDAVVEVRQLARADDRATEAVALQPAGQPPTTSALAVNSLTWTQALRGRPVAHLVERYHALSTERATMARHPERIAGQQLVWRGEVDAGAADPGDLPRARPRSGPRPTPWRGCTCASWSCGPAGGTRSSGCSTSGPPRPTATCCSWPMYERCRGLLAAGRGDVDGRPALGEPGGGRSPSPPACAGTGSRPPVRSGLAALLDKDLAGGGRPPRRRLGPHPAGGRAGPRRLPRGPGPGRGPGRDGGRTTPRRPWSTSLADRAREQEHPWARAGAQRGAALVEIHGDAYTDAAGDALEAAAATYGGLGLAFDEARTLLALGRAQRRAKKWGAARDVLERTVAAFEAIGSPGWADDARAELERVGARKPAASGGLTATERRVADLAVEGLANKEIARTLVVTVNTVEFHLATPTPSWASARGCSSRRGSRRSTAARTDGPPEVISWGRGGAFPRVIRSFGGPVPGRHGRAMAEYLVELYVAQGDQNVAQRHAESAEQAGAELTREGRPVRCCDRSSSPRTRRASCSSTLPRRPGRRGRAPSRAPARAHLGGHLHHRRSRVRGCHSPEGHHHDHHPTDYTELRDKQQKVWSSGDYNKIAALTVPVSEHLVDHVGVMPGERVLDIATGTGHVALAAARRSANATGIDYVPELLEIARRRAAGGGAGHRVRRVRRRGPAVRRRDVRRRRCPRSASCSPPTTLAPLASWSGCAGPVAASRWPAGRPRASSAACSPPSAGTSPRRPGRSRPPAGASRPWSPSFSVTSVTDVASVTETVRQRFAAPRTSPTCSSPTTARRSRPRPGWTRTAAPRCAPTWSQLADSFDKDAGNGVIVDWEYRIVTATPSDHPLHGLTDRARIAAGRPLDRGVGGCLAIQGDAAPPDPYGSGGASA